MLGQVPPQNVPSWQDPSGQRCPACRPRRTPAVGLLPTGPLQCHLRRTSISARLPRTLSAARIGTVGGADRNGQFVDSMLEFFLRDNEAPRPVPVHQFDDFLRRMGRPRTAHADEVDIREKGLNGWLLVVPQQGPAGAGAPHGRHHAGFHEAAGNRVIAGGPQENDAEALPDGKSGSKAERGHQSLKFGS